MTAVAALLLLSDSPPSTRANFPAIKPLILGQDSGTSENSWAPEASASIDQDPWDQIIIHHSGRMTGTVRDLDARAKSAGLNGVGYHFVIGNGSGLSDGVVEKGYRWTQFQSTEGIPDNNHPLFKKVLSRLTKSTPSFWDL